MSRRLVLAVLGTAAVTSSALAYTRPRFQIGPDVKQSRWRTTIAVSVSVNTNPPNSIVPGSQPLAAIRNAYELRSAYSAMRFSIAPGFVDNLSFDGTSLVTFADTFENRSVTFGYGAVTFFWFTISGGEPILSESDIAFNPAIPHTTTGAGGSDIEALATHELTHFLSFEHSAVVGAGGFPSFDGSDPGRRRLKLDDQAGIEFLYPFADTATRLGSLSGSVLKGGATPVFGAHVVALRQADGAPVSDVSVGGGQWRIDGLPPGTYTVYAEPLDGPAFPFMIDDGIYGGSAFDTSFPTSFAGGNDAPAVHTVSAGVETGGIVVAPAAAAPPLNPQYVGLSADGVTPVLGSIGVTLTQGTSGFLVVGGAGVGAVPDGGVTVSGPGVAAATSGIVRGTSGGTPYMIVPVTVAADAPPGLRTVLVDDGPNLGAMSGVLAVRRSTPLPGLLRNDAVVALSPISPALSTILPLRTTGTDGVPGTGEGIKRSNPGTSDDDDFYVPEILSGYLDADVGVAADATRPLVFYALTDASLTIRVEKTPLGRIRITY